MNRRSESAIACRPGPLYADLVGTPDEKGEAGDVTWNFEKFLVAADGTVIARFSPGVEPGDARLVDAVKTLASA